MQVSAAAREPGRTFIADPPASWLDDFLSWLSPGLPHCCREDPQGQQCPPPDQFPCNTSASACAACATCFTTGSGPDPRVLPHNRPTLQQVILSAQHCVVQSTTSCLSRMPRQRLCSAVLILCMTVCFCQAVMAMQVATCVVAAAAAAAAAAVHAGWCSIVHVSAVHLSPQLHQRHGVLQCHNMRHVV
jgi:hypothetical protein